ncbi:MAG: nucleotidyltransferase family protein [Acidobacteriaceae bacterium]
MVLAAGLGTRLRPLTDDCPKALVTVSGRTLLEITLARLRGFDVRDVVVNAHHYAEMIVAYLAAHGNFGMSIEVSREETLLDTGGGLKKAAAFFLQDDEPFFVHNVDVISTIDLVRMAAFHREQGALATLAVAEREASRLLLFDAAGQLCGRPAKKDADPEQARPANQTHALAFAGIHVVSPRIFALMREEGAFSIIDAYLRLAAQGEKVVAFRADGAYWRDLGRPESVAAAERDVASGVAGNQGSNGGLHRSQK